MVVSVKRSQQLFLLQFVPGNRHTRHTHTRLHVVSIKAATDNTMGQRLIKSHQPIILHLCP